MVALVAFAASGLAADAGGPTKLRRASPITVRVHFGRADAKVAAKGPRTIYGSASTTVPPGNRTVALGKCPKKTHIVNGTLAALHGEQAPDLAVHGYGLASPKTWFVDVGNVSNVNSAPGFPVKAVGFIVCEKN
jgi:hypothetical protein